MNKTIEKIKNWSMERDLHNQDPKTQAIKLLEEFGELARGLLKNDQEIIVDSLGDMLVVLIILHQQLGYTLNGTLHVAWNEIKNRKGKTIDGVFVKESDLK